MDEMMMVELSYGTTELYKLLLFCVCCINRKTLQKYEDMNLSKPFQTNLPHAKKKNTYVK